MNFRRLRFAARLERYPPILLRLLTIYGRRPHYCPDDREFAEACGLPLAEVKRISYSTSWDDITVAHTYAFFYGCGIDLEKRRTWRRLEWMRRYGHFRHLRRSELWETQWRDMVNVWADSAEP